MQIRTRDYGEIDIDESAVIRFEEGIIGFEDFHDYVLLSDDDELSPFKCLQSIDERDLAFILLDPFRVKPDYEIDVDDATAGMLSVSGDGDIAVFAIVVVPEDIKMMSFNLKAPLIINANAKKGAQFIVDKSEYGIRHYVLEEMERARNAGIAENRTAV